MFAYIYIYRESVYIILCYFICYYIMLLYYVIGRLRLPRRHLWEGGRRRGPESARGGHLRLPRYCIVSLTTPKIALTPGSKKLLKSLE